MNWQYLFCYMVVDVFCLVLAGIVARTMHEDSGSELQVRYFRRLLVAYFAFVVTDAVWAVCTIVFGYASAAHAIVVFNLLNVISVIFGAYFWFCYAESRLESPLVYDRRKRILAALPLLLIPVFHSLGDIFGLNFTVLPDGTVENGPMYTASTLIALAYLVVPTIDSLVKRHREVNVARRRTYLTFASFIIAPVAAAIIDIFVPAMPVVAPAMLISIVLVLLSLQESRISSDALTGLNNRRRADAFLEEGIAHADAANPLYFFIIDMDFFKVINDTYGHLEGDHALQLMAEALRRSCAQMNAFAARWGGDEFVMICVHGVQGGPEAVEAAIKQNLHDAAADSHVAYDLSCSVGYAVANDPAASTRALVHAADERLYTEKQATHASR